MWRKTRSNYGTACTGVDPNRNFDAAWSGPGASANPCSETYYGPEVESEQLTKGLSNFIRLNRGNIKVIFNPYHPNPEKIDDFDIAGSLGHK